MKKLTVIILVLAFVISLLSGCGFISELVDTYTNRSDDLSDNVFLTPTVKTPAPAATPEPEPAQVVRNAEIEAWAIGCSAILAASAPIYDPYQFGMFDKDGFLTALAAGVLADSWGCYGRADLIRTIERLVDYGHNGDFAEAYLFINSLSESEYMAILEESDDLHAYMWPLTKSLGDKWEDKQIKAWDLFRIFHLAGWGYVSDYIELDEAYDIMLPIIERLKETFSSWDEAVENYMDGYAWWSLTDIYQEGTEYKRRLRYYEEMREDKFLFNPTVWTSDFIAEEPGEHIFGEDIYDHDPPMPKKVDETGRFEYQDNGDGTCAITDYLGEVAGDLVIPEKINGLTVTEIESSAFRECSGFTGTLTLPEGLIRVGNGAFSRCSGFTGELILPQSLEIIHHNAFYKCSGFTGPLVIPDRVTFIGNQTFYDCSGFTGNLVIPHNVADIHQTAFRNCIGIPAIDVSEKNQAYMSIDGVLFTKDRSVLVLAPAGMKRDNYEIPPGTKEIGTSAFYGCTGFTGTITVPGGVTALNGLAFSHCSNITGIVLPKSLTSVGNSAFSSCSKLVLVEFQGDAPVEFGKTVFKECARNLKLTYDPAKSGWSTPEWNGYPCYPR